MRYAIGRGLARLLLAVFYRRIEVRGLERVPASGPLVVAANHHNALVDAMLLLATIPRRLAPLAKAPLFTHPVIAPFLWLVGAIPVHRRQDGDAGGPDNAAMFAEATRRLRHDGAILIFPEGVSQPEPVLLPLRTGLARVTLEAAAQAERPVPVLPVGLVFDGPADFRTGSAVVEIGAPVDATDLMPAYRHNPAVAVRTLTERVTAALRALIVEARDVRTLRLLAVAHQVWRTDGAQRAVDDRLAWMREGARRLHALPLELRERVERVRRELARYEKDAGTATPPAGRALRDGAVLALGLPLAVLGVLIHGLGYRATVLVVRALRPEPDVSATYQLVAGSVLLPLSWVLEAAVVARLFGPWATTMFALALVPAGFFALSWRARLQRFPREVRAAFGGGRRARLEARRRWLRAELAALDELTRAPHVEARSAR